MKSIVLTLAALSLIACQSHPKKDYAFSRMHKEGLAKTVEPRGGNTTGPKVEISSTKNPYFEKIKATKSKKEKDRLAILSQAGEFKVSFEFLETLALSDNYTELQQPYFSWATEYVFPIEERENFISLQHVLVMNIKNEKGKKIPTYVVKHWRQDWTYEKPYYMDYKGHNVWEKEELSKKTREKTWVQEVFQVDDSPRYTALGKWSHQKDYSTWTSQASKRPLPRREFSVRSDYDILEAINRVTVTPHGWVHEQDNLKIVVDPKSFKPIKTLVREIGINRYQAIKNYDFSMGHSYWKKTSDYWRAVRAKWQNLFSKRKRISLKKEVDGKKLYKRHFEFAQGLEKGHKSTLSQQKNHAHSTIEKYLN